MSHNENNNDNIEIIKGDPKKAILKLSIPMMLSMFLIMLYNIVDSIWVAGLGPDSLAAIGFITPLFIILVGLGNGIGAGANSLIARFIGADNYKQANNAGLHALLLGIVISIIFTLLVIVFIKPILLFMGAGNTIKYAMDYSYILFSFLIVFVYLGVASAIFRSEGDMKRATISIAATSVLNIILDPLFIYILKLGISGAAWATVISALISSLIMTYWIWGKNDLYLDLTPKNFSYSSNLIKENLEVAIPSTLEGIIFSALTMAINALLVSISGTNAVAVYTASMRIVQLANIPLMGIGTAVLTIAGVAYGARNPQNLKTAHSYSMKLSFLFAIILGTIMVILSNQIASIFSYTAASSHLAPEIASALSILSLFVLAITPGIMASMVFQGIGKGVYSLIITLLRSLLLETIFAYIFGIVLGWGVKGIYTGVIVGVFLGGIVGYIWAKIFIRRFEKINS